VSGDPHFTGAHGDLFSFRGGNGTIYAMHSSRHLQVNARFMPETFVMGGRCEFCGHLTVHGSFVKSIYVIARTAGNLNVFIEYNANQPSSAQVHVQPDGYGSLPTYVFVSKFKPEVASPRIIDDVSVELVRKHSREASITISNDDFTVVATSRFLGWAKLNQNKKRLDLSLSARTMTHTLEVAPHGLIGQTFDGDNIAIDGAVDDYSGKIVTTTAMGEGAIEGTAEDYEIDPDSPYSVIFKYTRFYAQHASPRDVSALTGLHRASKVGGLEKAFTQGDDLVADAAGL